MYIERKKISKELTQVILEVVGFRKIFTVDQKARDPEKNNILSLMMVCWQNSLLFQESQSLSLKAFGCVREAHLHYGGQPTFLKVYQFKNQS